jgi:hypothetical protein
VPSQGGNKQRSGAASATKPNPKAVGEVIESLFFYEGLRHGLTMLRPWGDNAGYDAAADRGSGYRSLQKKDGFPRLVTVQIRGVTRRNGRSYKVDTRTGAHRRKIVPADADILAAYISPERAWYLIPVAAFSPANHISLYPHIPNSAGRWETYRDDWSVLRPARSLASPRPGRSEDCVLEKWSHFVNK